MIYLLLIFALFPFLVPVGAKRAVTLVIVALFGVVTSVMAIASLTGVELPATVDRYSFTPLAAIFALLFAIVFPAAILCDSVDNQRSPALHSLFYGSSILLYLSLLGVLSASRLWDFALSWEGVGISSMLLMLRDGHKRDFLHSAVVYLITMHVGFIFILAGFLAVDHTGYLFGGGGVSLGAWLLFFVGFALKSAIFPLHFWLPSAYRASAGTGAALLSGGATNIGFYGILLVTFNSLDLAVVSLLMICLGVVGTLFGAFKMIRANTFSGVLSYSSVENLGVIVFAIGVSFYAKNSGATLVAVLAFAGAMVRIFTHGASKALMFSAIGRIKQATSTDALSDLGGLVRSMPFASFAFAAGGLSLSAVPVMGGFLAEFLIYAALFIGVGISDLSIVSVVGIVALALASASTVFNISKSFGVGVLGSARSLAAQSAVERCSVSVVVGYCLLVGAITIGSWLLCYAFFDLPLFGGGHSESLWPLMVGIGVSCGLLIALTTILWQLRRWLIRGRKNSIAPTWSCAYSSAVNAQTQYTAESFALEASLVVSYQTGGLRAKTRKSVVRFVSPMSVMRRWTARLALMQTGRMSHYVMQLILFLALVLILTICSAL